MGRVVGIACIIHTGAVAHARTDGNVYLGLGGREFGLDSPSLNDFEFGSQFIYLLGSASGYKIPGQFSVKVAQRDRNDPGLGFPIDTEAVLNLPRYIRFEPEDSDDEWNLTYAEARVHIEEERLSRTILRFSVPVFVDAKKNTFIDLWLGNQTGKIAYLSRVIP